MSIVAAEQPPDSVASVPEPTCRLSAGAIKEVMAAESDREPGLFTALCQKLLCRRDYDSDNGSDVCRVQDVGLCSMCCGGLYPRRSEQHRTVVSNRKQISVHWLPSTGNVETVTRQPGSVGHHRQPKCSCVSNISNSDSCEAGMSRACADPQPGGATLRRHDARMCDSLQRGKQTSTMRRVMLADAAYGHATVLDDCMLSDSDAWSASLSLSRPNSGTNSLERGASSTAQENADEENESYSDEEEENIMWPPVMPLPALPVYDQV